MARFSLQMSFSVPPQQKLPYTQVMSRVAGGSVRYTAGDGIIAVTAVVRAESAAAAALQVCRLIEREEAHRGRGPVRLVSWTATRSVPVFAGLGRRTQRFAGEGPRWDDEGDGDGTAGVREPRRPHPSPGTMSAALEPPHDVWGRFPA
jgi:hypothetical protein